MADYPLPAFHFRVDWNGKRIGFTEVSGLKREHQVIEYREGASPEYSVQKMPGIPKFDNITCKRGIVAGDNDFWNWLQTTQLNTVARRDVTISLLNEKHEPVMVWKARNAFPVTLEGPGLKSTGNEVAIETLVFAHEGITTETP